MTSAIRRRNSSMPSWLPPVLYGFVYWLVFLLVLEPDNVLRAWRAGYLLPLGQEALRITGAALLGATFAAPAQSWLTRQFPLFPSSRWRNALIHLAANASLAMVLIVASCFLASWAFDGRLMPSLADVGGQLASNGTLLVFALSAFTAIVQMIRFFQPVQEARIVPIRPERATRVPIKIAGRLRLVDQSSIDWMESQGNYLALHTGASMQLIRRTLTDFETELDTGRFVRIHRRVIVALDRIREMKPLANGDASLLLIDGHELRVSRRYRQIVRERWAGLLFKASANGGI